MRNPCIVCGNAKSSETNRHHLLPREARDREGNDRQVTVRLCAEKYGCMSHFNFHMGDKQAAINIRKNLEPWQVEWMVERVGAEWVQTIYPEVTDER